MKTKRIIQKHLPEDLNPEQTVVFWDKNLAQYSFVLNWIQQFRMNLSLDAGEQLKQFDSFLSRVQELDRLASDVPCRQLIIVSIGGGSVSDFVGFLASVYKRGVRLIHIPSTWLAAIDSVHGGKTGLNLGRVKNQIGTFWLADSVYLAKDLLNTQPKELQKEALSELIKVALLVEGDLYDRFKQFHSARQQVSQDHQDLFWDLISLAIEAKNSIVEKDPRENKGLRQILNLGHTWAHALEANCELSHGKAVACGLDFSLKWSVKRVGLDVDFQFEIQSMISSLFEIEQIKQQTRKRFNKSPKQFLSSLQRDKKQDLKGKVNFVFLEARARPCIIPVDFEEVLSEAREQEWIL